LLLFVLKEEMPKCCQEGVGMGELEVSRAG
jgi:hypothetical protein